MTNSELLLYQTEDGQTKIDVRLEEETVWLSQAQMVELFQTTKQNISLHIKNIYEEGELDEISTVKDYLTVRTDGKRKVQRKITTEIIDETTSETQQDTFLVVTYKHFLKLNFDNPSTLRKN